MTRSTVMLTSKLVTLHTSKCLHFGALTALGSKASWLPGSLVRSAFLSLGDLSRSASSFQTAWLWCMMCSRVPVEAVFQAARAGSGLGRDPAECGPFLLRVSSPC